MNTIKVRNLEIGTECRKICVPIVGKTVPEILENAKSAVQQSRCSGMERDWHEDVISFECTSNMSCVSYEITGEIPLYSHSVHCRRGGEQAIDVAAYRELNEKEPD